MAKTHSNPQPWLDYFSMLRTYEQKGYLEVQPQKHEAYATRAAFATLVNADAGNVTADNLALRTMHYELLHRIRAYAAYLAVEGPDYLRQPFALHVVRDDQPHDLLLTLLLTRRRRWYTPWHKSDHIDVITYTEEEKKVNNEK